MAELVSTKTSEAVEPIKLPFLAKPEVLAATSLNTFYFCCKLLAAAFFAFEPTYARIPFTFTRAFF